MSTGVLKQFIRLVTEERVNYFSSPFALYVSSSGQIILYNAANYPNDNCVAGYVKVRQDKINCPSAVQIAQAARSPAFPGAGEAIYKIASTVYNMPITSDRKHSTSDLAQNMWKKIDGDPSFQKQELDNWIWNDDNETKTYALDINKTNNSCTPSADPKTPSTQDDCMLPGEPVNKENPEPGLKNSLSILGAPNAYKATVEIAKLMSNHNQLVKEGVVQPAIIKALADKLWNTRM